MLDLLSQMLSRMTLIITIAFLITRLKIFRDMMYRDLNWKGKGVLVLVFGVFGIIGNYTAIVVNPEAHIISNVWNPSLALDHAIADTRNIGVIIGGFVGGPIVGLGAAILAGGHRFLLGGFINEASFLTSVIGGLLAGLYGRKLRLIGLIRPVRMLSIGFVILTVQILLIPVFAGKHATALHLIGYTGVPIIIINSIGIWICSMIFYSVTQAEEKTRANETAKALAIADQTLSLFRQGINETSAKKAAKIIRRLTNTEAVAITRGIRQLAHTGSVFFAEKSLQQETDLRKNVLQSGNMYINQSPKRLFAKSDTYKTAFIILPLRIKQKSIGTLTLYFRNPFRITRVERELAEGLGKLLSSQLEFGEVERYNSLLQDAEIRSLHAQIHPHFLFNALNTIVALCRMNPMLARELLLHLSTFLRNNLQGMTDRLVRIEKEIENVNAYLALEQARFPDKFELSIEIDPDISKLLIPPFILQPLVENAINHGGFKELARKGEITLQVTHQQDLVHMVVTDNGQGVAQERLQALGQRAVTSAGSGTGTALFNIKERLTAFYGQDASFFIESEIGSGTTVTIKVPVSL